MELAERIEGLVLGQAVGDAVGLPREGLTPRRAHRRFGPGVRHTMILGRGLLSDDTEHAFMTAQAVLASNGDPRRFERSLAWRLRGWIAALPCGVGWATLRACLRLWVGLGGVRSAGNGPLMRAPLIGAVVRDPTRRAAFVAASTRLTHTDPLALEAAAAVAEAAAAARDGQLDPRALLAAARDPLRDARWQPVMKRLEHALLTDQEPASWAVEEGLASGISGFVLHTLPAVLLAWLRAPTDYVGTLRTVLALGGDTDTSGAIAGALAGVAGGVTAIPPPLRAGLADWPLSAARLRGISARLARHATGESVGTEPTPARVLAPIRNLVVTVIILAHLGRRLFPPY